MEIGIYGLPYSGKSVFFNLVTNQESVGDVSKTRLGTVAVPDERLDQLVAWYDSKKITPIHLEFHDPGIGGGEKEKDSLSNARLNAIRNLDFILLVVRCFNSDLVPHSENSIDPARDLDLLLTQLIMADLEIIAKRMTKLGDNIMKLPKDVKEPLLKEKDVLTRINTVLESDNPWEQIELTDQEKKLVKSYALFHLKKFAILGNLGDLTDEKDKKAWESLQEAASKMGFPVVGVNVALENELKDVGPEEANRFQGINGPGSRIQDIILKTIYSRMGTTTFYTAGPTESAARVVPAGSTAPKAAGTIHSDMEKGFIRMEVMSYKDLEAAEGSEAKVKQSGGFRLEGKEYIVQDGDIVIIRFSN